MHERITEIDPKLRMLESLDLQYYEGLVFGHGRIHHRLPLKRAAAILYAETAYWYKSRNGLGGTS